MAGVGGRARDARAQPRDLRAGVLSHAEDASFRDVLVERLVVERVLKDKLRGGPLDGAREKQPDAQDQRADPPLPPYDRGECEWEAQHPSPGPEEMSGLEPAGQEPAVCDGEGATTVDVG